MKSLILLFGSGFLGIGGHPKRVEEQNSPFEWDLFQQKGGDDDLENSNSIDEQGLCRKWLGDPLYLEIDLQFIPTEALILQLVGTLKKANNHHKNCFLSPSST